MELFLFCGILFYCVRFIDPVRFHCLFYSLVSLLAFRLPFNKLELSLVEK